MKITFPTKKAFVTAGMCTALASEGFSPIVQNLHSPSPDGINNELAIMMTASSNNDSLKIHETSPHNLFGLEKGSTLNKNREIEAESRPTTLHFNQRVAKIVEFEINNLMDESLGKITGMDTLSKFRRRAFDAPGEENKDLEFDTFAYTSMKEDTEYNVGMKSCFTRPNYCGDNLEWNSKRPEAATTYIDKNSPWFLASKRGETELFVKYFLGEAYAGSDLNEIKKKFKHTEKAIDNLIDRLETLISKDIGTDDVPEIDVTSIIETFTFTFFQSSKEKKKDKEKVVRNQLGSLLSSDDHPNLSKLYESGRLLIIVASNDDAHISGQIRELIIEIQDRKNDPGVIIEQAVGWLQRAETTEEKEVYLDIIKAQNDMAKSKNEIVKSQTLQRNISIAEDLLSKIAGSKTEEEKNFSGNNFNYCEDCN